MGRKRQPAAKLSVLKYQYQILQSTVKFLLLVAGFGTGKTYSLNLVAMTVLLAFPRVKIGIFAPTFDLLKLNNIPALLELFDNLGIQYTFNKSDSIAFLSNGSQVIFRSLDNPGRIIAFEIGVALVDELDTMPQHKAEEAWNKIVARVRQVIFNEKGELCPNKVWAFTTPEGFKFCYDRWERRGGNQYQTIKAKTTDNPFLPKDYVQGLYDSYPEQLIEAYINGEYVNLNAGAVYYTFSKKTHHRPFKEPVMLNEVHDFKQKILHVGVDFNVTKMAAIVHLREDNNLHAIQEFTKLRDTPELCETVKEYYPDNRLYFYPDSSGMNTKSSNASESDHAVLAGYGQVFAHLKNPRIKDRVAAFNNLIEKGRYHIDIDKCPDLAEALTQQAYNKYGLPDKSSDLDHPVDGAGYCVNYLFPLYNRASQQSVVGF